MGVVRGSNLLAFVSAFLLFLSAYSDDSSTLENIKKTEDHGGRKGPNAFIICVVLVAVALLSFFLYRIWQKKKRDEQYARLLQLFEEDDELELELGLRD